MAVKKLSQIALSAANLDVGDYLLGVQGGTTDVLYSAGIQAGRLPLSNNRTFYVDPAGDDNTGDGSLANPWATPAGAYYWIGGMIDGVGYQIFVQIAAGSYDGVYLQQGPVCGLIQFQGVKGSPGAVTIGDGALNWAVLNNDPITPTIFLSDLTLMNGIGLFGGVSLRFGTLDGAIGNGHIISLGVSSDLNIRLDGPLVRFHDQGSNTIIDCTSAPNIRGFLDIDNCAVASFQSLKSITGTPAMSDGFFKISGNSHVAYNDATITGTATGKRFSITSDSQLLMFGAAETTIPGSLSGALSGGGSFTVQGDASRHQFDTLSLNIPITQIANFSVATNENWSINNKSGSTCTVTLPTAASYSGRIWNILNYQAQTVVSATSNVVPITGGSAGTAILAATAGKWATLVSDGTNWIITQSN